MTSGRLVLAGFVFSIAFASSQPLFSQPAPAAPPTQPATVPVPFVGCASDGQVGPLKAPTGASKPVPISTALAQRLAYYKAANGVGVLAPRGWNCFSVYGSDGSNLYLTPAAIDSNAFFSAGWKGFAGQAIEVSVSSGATSGRFQVAHVIMRVFPAYKAFAQNVIAEGVEPASSFPPVPYPNDKLTYRGKNVVEFETPANTQGLGTDSELKVGASPIDGVAVVTAPDTDLIQLSARMPDSDRDLTQAIVAQIERDAATP